MSSKTNYCNSHFVFTFISHLYAMDMCFTPCSPWQEKLVGISWSNILYSSNVNIYYTA